MYNFSRTPMRLDSTSPHMKVFFTFYMCLAMVFSIHSLFQVIPIFGSTTALQTDSAIQAVSNGSVYEDSPESSLSLNRSSTSKAKEISESCEPLETFEISETVFFESASPIPPCLYLHLENNSKFFWVPVVFEERISESDILVDLSSAIDPNGSYELSSRDLNLVNLAVQYEASGESFLGQLLVAEGIVGRIRSGIYGPDVSAILIQGYEAEADENGDAYFLQNGKKILEASPSVQQAVDLALSGSRVSYYLLQAITELRNEQYGLQLDDIYYKWGSIYHFNPEKVSIGTRSINQVPVSFQYGGHILYGRWLSESAQLNL